MINTELQEENLQIDATQSQQGWRKVRFGDVVRNVDINERDPLAKGIDRYIGLDHIDPESLHIKRWGQIEDGTSFTRKFTAGQVLFGKRRAYQRKVALAEFDGICSGDILVFEAKDGLIPELLPFIVQSDGFYEHALSTSAGSLSPRTKWKDLAAYEFALPPRDEQQRIADILWAADTTIELHTQAIEETEKILSLMTEQLIQNGLYDTEVETRMGITCPKDWKLKKLEDVAEVERGRFAHRPRNLPRFYGGQYPFVQTGDISRNKGFLQTYEQTLSEEGRAISRSFSQGSILITIAAIIGKTTITPFEVWCPDSIVGIVPHDDMNVYFLEFYLRTIQKELEEKTATQSAQKNINLNVLRPLLVPVPSLEEQKIISEILLSIQEQISVQEEHVAQTCKLKRVISLEVL